MVTTASLFVTRGDDTLPVNGVVATIGGTGYLHSSEYFDTIQAYSSAGGTDTAELIAPVANVNLIGDWQDP